MYGAADTRAFTVKDVMDIQNNIKGGALIWENVPSVQEDYLRELTLALEQAGYYVSLCRRDASIIGNAQERTRVFLCAVLNGPISIPKVVVKQMDYVAIGGGAAKSQRTQSLNDESTWGKGKVPVKKTAVTVFTRHNEDKEQGQAAGWPRARNY